MLAPMFGLIFRESEHKIPYRGLWRILDWGEINNSSYFWQLEDDIISIIMNDTGTLQDHMLFSEDVWVWVTAFCIYQLCDQFEQVTSPHES